MEVLACFVDQAWGMDTTGARKHAGLDYIECLTSALALQDPDCPFLYRIPLFQIIFLFLRAAKTVGSRVSDLYKEKAEGLLQSITNFCETRVGSFF